MTTLENERAEQARWRLRPEHAGQQGFDALLHNEFAPIELIRRQQEAQVRVLMRFAARNVPWYRQLFAEQGWDPDHPPDSWSDCNLPLLTRRTIQEHSTDLNASGLSEQDAPLRVTSSSGTTGQPVKVTHNRTSFGYFALLKQREYRWFRFDPNGRMGSIGPRRDVPQNSRGETVIENQTAQLDHWRDVGGFFLTGPYFGTSSGNAVEAQAAWLKRHRPDYLVALSADLEHLAFLMREDGRGIGLRGIEAISQQLTPEMRATIESSFGVGVNENYGLNEIGLVASRCPEGGRFHVHAEFCLLEILDEQNRPCPPGIQGRIVVSTLVNRAMPLFRYDADDLAEWAVDACPCGRSLPAFVNLVGRYRRTVNLPPGTWRQWSALQRCLREMPLELARPLRQYQLHQDREGRFQLKLAAAGTLPEEFSSRILAAWSAAAPSGPPPLTIVPVDAIPRPPSGKFQSFVSDWTPPMDAESLRSQGSGVRSPGVGNGHQAADS